MSAIELPPLSDASLIRAWERTRTLARPWREVGLLAIACGTPAEPVARLPVGERDRRLFALRERAFGGRLDCEAACPACGERIEWTLDAAEIRAPARDASSSTHTWSQDDVSVTFRLPDSADVAACRGSSDDPERVLLSHCVLSATVHGDAVASDALPRDVGERVAARMTDVDPFAELRLDLACPACAHRWEETFDPAGFLLAELDAWAERVMRDVDCLARAYGWSEADVLAVPPSRRRRYVEMASR
jgi:hypothetical protein